MSPQLLAQRIKSLAGEIGFDLCGITRADPLAHAPDYMAWLAQGFAGQMQYLHRNVEQRCDPGRLLPGARAVLCLAVNYHRSDGSEDESGDGPLAGRGPQAGDGPLAGGGPALSARAGAPGGRIAQYARGRDYHVVLREMLAELLRRIRAEPVTPFEARICVDTAPVLERELAARAGLGWIGKNTLLLNARLGSYLFLGEIITTLELPADEPLPDHCGTCTRCLDACPTGAFPAPHQLDATRCIAYLTIEHRGEIDPPRQAQLGDWVYGCDVCQEVCPHNRAAPLGTQPLLREPRLPARIDLAALLELRSGAYKRLTDRTAARRATRRMWERNARIAWNNATATDLRTAPPPPLPIAAAPRPRATPADS